MIEVAFSEKEVARLFSDKIEKQIPFATSLAINATAQDARDELRERLNDSFTIRSRWLHKGIRYTKSNKKQPTIAAEIGSIDDFMAKQAEGGTKRAGSAGYVAIPSRVQRGPGGKRKTTPAKWPGALLKKDRRAKVQKLSLIPGSSGNILLFRRRGGKRNPKFQLLYTLAKQAKIPKLWPFEKTVDDVVSRRWSQHMKAALDKALRTAK